MAPDQVGSGALSTEPPIEADIPAHVRAKMGQGLRSPATLDGQALPEPQ
jgi:hypothetical protein